MLIQTGVSNNNGPGSTGKERRESPYLWLSVNSCHSTVTVGEWPAGQGRSEQAAPGSTEVHFSCHIEGDLRLCWSDEDGSGGIWSWAGSGAPSVCGTVI